MGCGKACSLVLSQLAGDTDMDVGFPLAVGELVGPVARQQTWCYQNPHRTRAVDNLRK